MLKDQGAQEYAANQTREEARHVTAFAKYVKARWGRPRPCGTVLKQLLVDIISAPEVYKKIIGMQMLVEGLAMGAFATGYKCNQRSAGQEAVPAGDDRRGLPPQVRQDLGRPHDSEADARKSATWSRTGRRTASSRCSSTWARRSSRRRCTSEFGLDPAKVMEGLMELRSNDERSASG